MKKIISMISGYLSLAILGYTAEIETELHDFSNDHHFQLTKFE